MYRNFSFLFVSLLAITAQCSEDKNPIEETRKALTKLCEPIKIIAVDTYMIMQDIKPTLEIETQHILNTGKTELKLTLDKIKEEIDPEFNQSFEQIYADAEFNITLCFKEKIKQTEAKIKKNIITIEEVIKILEYIPQSVDNCSNKNDDEKAQCLGQLIGKTLLDAIALGSLVRETVENTAQLLSVLNSELKICIAENIDEAVYLASIFDNGNISGFK